MLVFMSASRTPQTSNLAGNDDLGYAPFFKGQIWQEMMTLDMLHFSQLKKFTILLKSIHEQRKRTPLVRKMTK